MRLVAKIVVVVVMLVDIFCNEAWRNWSLNFKLNVKLRVDPHSLIFTSLLRRISNAQ